MLRGKTTINESTMTDFAAAHAQGAVTVDVREPGEYVGGHVPNAQNIPLDDLGVQASHLARDLQGAPVYVICGGTAAWTRAGHPLVNGSRPA